jgi:hypothetical protein
MRSRPARILFILLLLVAALPAGAVESGKGKDKGKGEKPRRPHIILVMADDQGWGDVGYNGHPHLKTPNLDAAAAAGLRLDHF